MVKFTATIEKFTNKGEKSGWTYFTIPEDIAQELQPGNRKTFRVKGKLDRYAIKFVAILPMGDGSFIMPLNQAMRKGIGKKQGAMLEVQLSVDTSEFVFDPDFMACLEDEPKALAFFKSIPLSFQKYFSNWIASAKTEPTKTKRIAQALTALSKHQNFGEMIRSLKKQKE